MACQKLSFMRESTDSSQINILFCLVHDVGDSVGVICCLVHDVGVSVDVICCLVHDVGDC